jgi:hypothetical protein
MAQCMGGATHGDVHLMVGGVWAHDGLAALADELGIAARARNQLFFVTKNLWRQGLVRAPESCDASRGDRSGSSGSSDDGCVSSCPAALWRDRNRTALEMLVATGQMHWLASYPWSV